MKSSMHLRTRPKVGVLAALSRNTYLPSLPSRSGTVDCTPTTSCRRSARVFILPLDGFILAPVLTAGMIGTVNFFQILSVNMGVNLGRRNIDMPQHLLHGTEVSAPLKEVRRKRMAERMRMYFLAHSRPCG